MQPTIDRSNANPKAILADSVYRDPEGRFEIVARDGARVDRFLQMDAYTAANAFVDGQFTVWGDLLEAIRFFGRHEHSAAGSLIFSIAARLGRLWDGFRLRSQTSADIRFHYDRSNDFYEQFLDSRMQYSEADFSDPGQSLEEAQLRKLNRICTALKLQPGERLLDVGCGWGGLLIHAAEKFGVDGVGCTLSPQQFEFADDLLRRRGLAGRVSVRRMDYRDLEGRFDKIVSVGMFEHVGRRRLPEYFKRIRALLHEGGLFLNRGIVRPEGASDGPETLFIQRRVFPGGELVPLSEVIHYAGIAGFEALQMQDLRRDYALTCKAWVLRLQANAEACRRVVDDATYRTWLLYLAASSVYFEDGTIDDTEVLFTAPGPPAKLDAPQRERSGKQAE